MTAVYKITNKLNKKVYVGQSRDIYHRFSTHKSNPPKSIKIDITCIDDLEFKVLEVLDDDCLQEELDATETWWIEELLSNDAQYGYNKTNGGKKGTKVCEETVCKIRSALTTYYRNNKVSKEIRNKISASRIGSITSDDTKQKQRNSMIGKNVGKNPFEPRKVICVESGEIFNSIKEVGEKFDCSGSIYNHMAGRRPYSVMGKWHFNFVELPVEKSDE